MLFGWSTLFCSHTYLESCLVSELCCTVPSYKNIVWGDYQYPWQMNKTGILCCNCYLLRGVCKYIDAAMTWVCYFNGQWMMIVEQWWGCETFNVEEMYNINPAVVFTHLSSYTVDTRHLLDISSLNLSKYNFLKTNTLKLWQTWGRGALPSTYGS